MFAKMHLLSLGVWLCGSFGSLFAQETENDPRDFAALADPARLEQLVAECQRLGDEVRGEAFDTPTLSLASQAVNECLIKAAVKEFSENLSSTGFDAATFERELREGAERQAGLISDLYCYDRYELNVCGTMGAAYFEGAKQEYVLEILSELWAIYSRFAP